MTGESAKIRRAGAHMAIKCPQCGAEYDVTLFTFGRGLRCECGAWVDLDVGHQEAVADGGTESQDSPPRTTSSTDDDALLAVFRTAYQRLIGAHEGNIEAARIGIAAVGRVANLTTLRVDVKGMDACR